jgi:predicted RNase H-like HicB family nuclease
VILCGDHRVTGDTLDEVKAEIAEAIALHLEGMREDGLPIPPPTTKAEYVEVGGPRPIDKFDDIVAIKILDKGKKK